MQIDHQPTELTEPVLATEIVGHHDDTRFADRRVTYIDLGWGDAGKHRQIAIADDGTEVQLRLPRASYLSDGAVVADDGERVVVVRRLAEPAISVDFAANAGPDGARRMLLLGYLLGNQHAPLDVTAERVATPLMTSPETATQTLRSLHVHGVVAEIPLACNGWSNTSADHHHGTHSHHDGAHSHGHD